MEKCVEQNIHGRNEDELTKLKDIWEPCSKDQLRLDEKPLIAWSQIPEIPVEDISNDELDDEDMELGNKKCSNTEITAEVPKSVTTEPVAVVSSECLSKDEEVKPKSSEEVVLDQVKCEDPESNGDCTSSDIVVEDRGQLSAVEKVVQAMDKETNVEEATGTDSVQKDSTDAGEVSIILMKWSYLIISTLSFKETVPEETEEDLEAQLQEDLDTNFEDLEGEDVPMPEDEEEDEDVEPESIDVSIIRWLI